MKKLTEEDYEKKFYAERKDFITLVFENGGIAICDRRFMETTVRCRPIRVIKSKKWKDVYDFCRGKGFLK